MASVLERLEALDQAAQEQGLTPLAWWIGAHHHDEVLDAVTSADDVDVATEGDRLKAIDGREVKVLSETPDRLALWCEEGALDL